MQREHLGSRLGFILLSAGCAIGVGNVWKFPYITGQNGGGFFVLVYLFFMLVLGIPVMTMEFAVGRASQKSPVNMYRPLEQKGHKWHWHGIACLVGSVVMLMCYCTITGWLVQYFVDSARGVFVGLDAEQVGQRYVQIRQQPGTQLLYAFLVVILGTVVCSFGLQKGLERITKYMMLALLVIMIVLAVNSIFQEGGEEGLAFYLLPSMEQVRKVGLGNIVVAAMNQAFFSLSLGIGSMAIFGSYLKKDRALMGEALNVALLDTFVALTAGLIIFPACFAHGVEVNAGPSLIFITLPNVFNSLPGGRVWGSLFFLFMSFAALSTVFAVVESVLACVMELTGWSRRKTSTVIAAALLVLTAPCALGWSLLADFHPFGGTSTVMDLEDFAVSNVLLPLGSLVIVLFCTGRRGWGWKRFAEEANAGRGLKVAGWMRLYMTWGIPVAIGVLFLIGIINFFG